MTETEMMQILSEKEFKRLNQLKTAFEMNDEWSKRHWKGRYQGVIYLKKRLHTKFQSGDKSLEELVEIVRKMEDYYGTLSDKAHDRKDFKAEDKWLNVYLEAGFLHAKLKSMLEIEKRRESAYKIATWEEVRKYANAKS